MRGQVKEWWGKLTDDDLEHAGGKADRLIGLLQQKYGYTHEQAGQELERRLKDAKAGQEEAMSIAKVIEVLAEGDSIETAVQLAVSEAAETVRGIKHVYVESVQALVEGDVVVKYRVNAKLTFVVETGRD